MTKQQTTNYFTSQGYKIIFLNEYEIRFKNNNNLIKIQWKNYN